MKRIILTLWLGILALQLAGCATVKLGSIPKPADTTRLRVAVLPISGPLARGHWGKSVEEFSDSQYRLTRKQLDRLGYYEVVPEVEVATVLGEYRPDRWNLLRNEAELARQVGLALHADYLLLVERGTSGEPNYYFEVTLINMASAARFGVRIDHNRGHGEQKLPKGTGKLALRELFRDAKQDLLATALRKVRQGTAAAATPPADRRQPGQPAAPGSDPAKPPADSGSRLVAYPAVDPEEAAPGGSARRLVVYDLTTTLDSYRQVALILSEALREEIQNRGSYGLVNRENLLQLADELKFQQSGLVDSSKAIKLGKVAGAEEIVTGNFGALGRGLVLQSKRTDLQTMLNLSQASLQAPVGEEEQLLNRLGPLVDKLLVNQKRLGE